MKEKEAEAIIALVTNLLKDEKARGYVFFGMVNKDGKLEAGASVKSVTVGDVAVSTAGLITKVAQQK